MTGGPSPDRDADKQVQPDGPSMSNRARVFVSAVTVIGGLVLARSIMQMLEQPVSWLWVTLAALTAITGIATLRVPGKEISFSISDTFSIIAALLVGPAAGAVTAALDGFVLSCRMLNSRRSVPRVLFNTAFPAMATWVSAEVFLRLGGQMHLHHGPLGTLTMVGLLGVFGALDFLLTTWTVATAIGLSTSARVVAVWREHFLGLWITYFGGVFAASLMMAVDSLSALEVLVLIAPLPVLLYVVFTHAQARARDQIHHLGKMNKVYVAAIEALAQAVDSKDQVTHEHVRRVQTQSLQLARAIGVTDELVLEALKAAALLHDVGKIGVPEHILNKPGRLTPSEFEIMKQHAPMGADILSRIDFPYPVVPIVRHHHENWDGTGYPDRIAGEDIPIGARILQIVDCFDALTSDRPYRRAISRLEAFRILAQRKGTMYDPRIVDAFFALQTDNLAELVTMSDSFEEVRAATPPSLQPASEGAEDASLPLDSFYKIGRAIRRRSSLGEVGQALWTHLQPHVPAEAFVLYTYDAGSDALAAAFCSHENLVNPETRIPLGERLSGWVAATKRPVVNSDARLDLQDQVAANTEMASILGVPAVLDDQVVAVLAFYSRTPAVFTESHCRIAETSAAIVAEQGRRTGKLTAVRVA